MDVGQAQIVFAKSLGCPNLDGQELSQKALLHRLDSCPG